MKEVQHTIPTDNLSCYSDRCPPELNSLVVVKVDRVDKSGIWGVLVDWQASNCTAYLPMGSIGKEKGRGERKAQMHFLTLARRSIKTRHGMTFVASVQDIDDTSQPGVADGSSLDIAEYCHHITVTRRGVTNALEKATMDLSKDTQCCGKVLVDKAAMTSGVPLHVARQITMYAAYGRAVRKNKEDEDPHQAPVEFL
ncbi:MAG: hypothetical protein SGARI_001852, partial [Bacillariaceae sp.]